MRRSAHSKKQRRKTERWEAREKEGKGDGVAKEASLRYVHPRGGGEEFGSDRLRHYWSEG